MKKYWSLFGPLAHQSRNAVVLGLGDALMLLVALGIGRLVVHLWFGDALSVRLSVMIIPVWLVGAVMVGLLPGWGLGEVEELRRMELLLVGVFALGGVVYFFVPGWFAPSRIAFVISFCVAGFGLPLVRLGVKKLLARAGNWGCPAVVYGELEETAEVIRHFHAKKTAGYRVVGVFTDDSATTVENVPVLGRLSDMAPSVPAALICMRSLEQDFGARFDQTLGAYRYAVLLPRIDSNFFAFVTPRTIGGVIGLEVTNNLLNPFAHLLKRVLDLLLVIFSAPVWLPVIGMIAGVIRLVDRHPALFRQERMGLGGRPFVALKFQTMRPDAERVLAEALEKDSALREKWNISRKLKDDPRITTIGRFLRRWSLDELPQLINVLRGEMSLVGPRPLPDYHHADLHHDTRRLREQVLPGMTGLWQISGRSDAGTEALSNWDRYYVRNWTVWLDIVILTRTLLSVAKGEGAY